MKKRWWRRHRNSNPKSTQAARWTEAVHPHTNSDPWSQGKTYSTPDAVMKIKTVKPEKAANIENALIRAAQTGALKNRISEKELVSMLEKDNESKAEQKITVTASLVSSSAEGSTTSGDIIPSYEHQERAEFGLRYWFNILTFC